MPQDLKMQIAVGVDTSSFSKAHTLVQSLISDFTKLLEVSSKAAAAGGLPGLSISGKGGVGTSPQQARALSQAPQIARPIIQNVMEHRNLFKGLAEGSKDSMRMMTAALKGAVDDQRKELKTLEGSAHNLINMYETLGRSIKSAKSDDPWVAGASQRQKDIASEHLTLQGQHAAGRKRLAELEQLGRPGEEEPAGGGFNKQSMMAGLKSAGRIGGLVLAGVSAVAHEVMAETRSYSSIGAQRANSSSGLFRQLMSGDVRVLAANRNMDIAAQNDLYKQVHGLGAEAEQAAKAVGGGVSGLLKGVTGGQVGSGGILDEAKKKQLNMGVNAIQMMQDNATAKGNMWNMAWDAYTGSMGGRMAAQRLIGTEGLKALAGQRGSTPYTAGTYEAAVAASLARDEETTTSGNGITIKAKKRRVFGYDLDARLGAMAAMRQAGGSQFGGFAMDAELGASLEGLGGYGQMMAMAGRAGGAGMGSRFARMAIGGAVDRYAGLQLGAGIAGTGFDVMGTTTGQGALEAAQRGMGFGGGITDFNLVQRAQAGMGFGNQMAGGTIDPWQRAQNLLTSMRINPSGDLYAQDFLANGMNFKQQLDMAKGGPLTGRARQLGLTAGMINDQMVGSFDKRLGLWTDLGGSNAMSNTMRSFRKSGMKSTDWLASLDPESRLSAIEGLSAALGTTGAKDEEAMGYAQLLAGSQGISDIKLGGVGRELSGAERETVSGTAAAKKKLADEQATIDKEIKDNSKNLAASIGTVDAWSKSMNMGAEEFVKAIGVCTNAIYDLTTAAHYQKMVNEANKTMEGVKALGGKKAKMDAAAALKKAHHTREQVKERNPQLLEYYDAL